MWVFFIVGILDIAALASIILFKCNRSDEYEQAMVTAYVLGAIAIVGVIVCLPASMKQWDDKYSLKNFFFVVQIFIFIFLFHVANMGLFW